MSENAEGARFRIELIGGFRVRCGDEAGLEEQLGTRAAELVQILALSEGRSLGRDDMIEALWPQLGADAGGANLRKAAHFARRALGDQRAVVLHRGTVALLPERSVEIDIDELRRAAAAATVRGDIEAARALAAELDGELLPQARYLAWADTAREELRKLRLGLLRLAGDWEQVADLDPTDESACVELMRSELAAGGRAAAIRSYGRLRVALRDELGVVPGAEVRELYGRCISGLGDGAPDIVGRELELARMVALLREPAPPQWLVLRGPAGIGKSALCRELMRLGGD